MRPIYKSRTKDVFRATLSRTALLGRTAILARKIFDVPKIRSKRYNMPPTRKQEQKAAIASGVIAFIRCRRTTEEVTAGCTAKIPAEIAVKMRGETRGGMRGKITTNIAQENLHQSRARVSEVPMRSPEFDTSARRQNVTHNAPHAPYTTLPSFCVFRYSHKKNLSDRRKKSRYPIRQHTSRCGRITVFPCVREND